MIRTVSRPRGDGEFKQELCLWTDMLMYMLSPVRGHGQQNGLRQALTCCSQQRWRDWTVIEPAIRSDRKCFVRFPTACYSYGCIIPNTSTRCCQLPLCIYPSTDSHWNVDQFNQVQKWYIHKSINCPWTVFIKVKTEYILYNDIYTYAGHTNIIHTYMLVKWGLILNISRHHNHILCLIDSWRGGTQRPVRRN